MNSQLPIHISGTDALNSIGENIIIADNEFSVIWMNEKAIEIMNAIAPLYGLTQAEDMIGLNMDDFHTKPERQRQLMGNLEDGHRARINIRGQFYADIVITPIKNANQDEQFEGYMVMLMDVTSQAEEEQKREKLIEELSVPILKIWEKTIALPLIGELDAARGETVIATVLEECASNGIEYAIISLNGIDRFDESVRYNLQKLYDCLQLIGVECIIVGIKPQLALTIQELKNTLTFSDSHAGLRYIIEQQEKKQSTFI
ncbi:STAS domain-containing protein [Salsuginibacillus kocurii]|uniref:STAS domain-containing protein n=1 Tax=Salsuginibacillus kocurii TaxID=427078 RepID=UPI0003811CE2|nr:STAS domain-containing protein [Salsuginibacillus kocurii]